MAINRKIASVCLLTLNFLGQVPAYASIFQDAKDPKMLQRIAKEEARMKAEKRIEDKVAQSKPKTQKSFEAYKASMESMGRNYAAMEKFLLEELPTYFKQNIGKHKQTNKIRGSYGTSLDGTQSLEEIKEFFIFSDHDNIVEAFHAFRLALGIDRADTDNPIIQKQIYQMQLAQAMYRYEMKQIPPPEAFVNELCTNWGLPYCKAVKDITPSPKFKAASNQANSDKERLAKLRELYDIDKLAQFRNNQVKQLATSYKFDVLEKRIKDGLYTNLDLEAWLNKAMPYTSLANTGLSQEDYYQLREELKPRLQAQIEKNKSTNLLLQESINFGYGVGESASGTLMAIPNLLSSTVINPVDTAVNVGGSLATCAAGATLGAILMPGLGTLFGGAIGCGVGLFGFQYTREAYSRADQETKNWYNPTTYNWFNPVEPGNRAALCNRYDVSLGHCLGYGLASVGTDVLMGGGFGNKSVGAVTTQSLNTFKAIAIKASADKEDQSDINQVQLFDLTGVDLSDEYQMASTYNAEGARSIPKGFSKLGNPIKGTSEIGKFALVNSPLVKNNLLEKVKNRKDLLEEAKDYSDSRKGYYDENYKLGRFEFEHQLPTNQYTSLGFDANTQIEASKLIAESYQGNASKASVYDRNSHINTNFIYRDAITLIRLITDKKARQIKGRTAQDLVKIWVESYSDFAFLMKQNPDKLGKLWMSDENILLNSDLFNGVDFPR